jgi:hypothetical protein
MKASNFKVLAASILALCVASAAFAEVHRDGNDRRFHDDLLEHFVGKWDVSATVHGQKFTLAREAEWIMGHQYLRIYERSHEVVPWLNVPFERTLLIGYKHRSKRNLVYELTVHGGDVRHEPEGFYYADRTGNELKMALTRGSEVVGYMRFMWEPASMSWRIQSGQVIAGKEQEPSAEMKAVAANPSSNQEVLR